jgi:hypothetical protein
VQAVGKDVDIGFAPRHHFAIHPDEPVAVVKGGSVCGGLGHVCSLNLLVFGRFVTVLTVYACGFSVYVNIGNKHGL